MKLVRLGRIGERVAKGYLKEDFKEVFTRYIPRSELEELETEVVANGNDRKAEVKDEVPKDGAMLTAEG